jgi:L-alanine-DL-glutamate epimerase-like enolase superfamily enzyme
MRNMEDMDAIVAMRRHTDAPFRVDANEAFSFEQAKELLPELQKLGVTLVEQPLPKAEWDAMKELKAISGIPLFADESCVEETDVAKCADSFHGINIKLAKCGGITPAIRMVGEARKLGLKLMMGSMNESTIGAAAIAHMLPLLQEVDADGPLLLKEDVGRGISYDKGKILLSGQNGLGVQFTGEKYLK